MREMKDAVMKWIDVEGRNVGVGVIEIVDIVVVEAAGGIGKVVGGVGRGVGHVRGIGKVIMLEKIL